MAKGARADVPTDVLLCMDHKRLSYSTHGSASTRDCAGVSNTPPPIGIRALRSLAAPFSRVMHMRMSRNTNRYRTRMQATLMDVELTKVADDPYLHFGDVVQLVHVDTGCVVAGDPNEQVWCESTWHAVACGPMHALRALCVARFVGATACTASCTCAHPP